MKKYLFVASNEWSNWGGSELLWSSTAKVLAHQGNEVRVSVPAFVKNSSAVEQLRSADCQVFFRPNFPPFLYRWGRRMLRFLPEYNLKRAATVEMLDKAMNRTWDNRSRLREIGAQAAIDVRQFVSRDPGESFARELGSLV